MGLLRIILALTVAVGHVSFWFYGPDKWKDTTFLVGPFGAVSLFFIISGYFMSMVYGNYRRPLDFYVSRALRLYPAYWIAVAIMLTLGVVQSAKCVFFFCPESLYRVFATGGLLGDAFFGFTNLTFFGIDLLFFLHVDLIKENLRFYISDLYDANLAAGPALIIKPAWSLALEVYFYCLVPLLHRQRNSPSFFFCSRAWASTSLCGRLESS